jgi:hypothetical protein
MKPGAGIELMEESYVLSWRGILFSFFGLNRFETLGIGLNLARQFRPGLTLRLCTLAALR